MRVGNSCLKSKREIGFGLNTNMALDDIKVRVDQIKKESYRKFISFLLKFPFFPGTSPIAFVLLTLC